MGTSGWVNHLHSKQTSKVSYKNWVLEVTIFYLSTMDHKETCWDTGISKYLTWILPEMAVKVGHADFKVFKLAEEKPKKTSHANWQETQLN